MVLPKGQIGACDYDSPMSIVVLCISLAVYLVLYIGRGRISNTHCAYDLPTYFVRFPNPENISPTTRIPFGPWKSR